MAERVKWADVDNILYADGVIARGNVKVAKFAVTDDSGSLLKDGINSKVNWQIEIEAFAILKAVEVAVEQNWNVVKIFTDCEPIAKSGLFMRGSSSAGKYLWVARKIAADNGLKVKVEWVPGTQNKADKYTR